MSTKVEEEKPRLTEDNPDDEEESNLVTHDEDKNDDEGEGKKRRVSHCYFAPCYLQSKLLKPSPFGKSKYDSIAN